MTHVSTDIPALARLARIDITEAESKKLQEQLPRILEYVGQLQSVTTELVASVISPVRLRGDEAHPSKVRNRILNAAPDRTADFWKVKAVL